MYFSLPTVFIGGSFLLAAFLLALYALRANARGKVYFRSIFDHSSMGIEIFDEDGKILDANHAALEMFDAQNGGGLEDRNLFRDYKLSDDGLLRLQRGETAIYEAAFARGKENVSETSLGSSNSIFEISITPFPGIRLYQEARYLVLFNDVTERAQAFERMKDQQIFLHNVIESIDNPFYVIDIKDYTIKLANSAAGFGLLTESSTCYSLTHHAAGPCGRDEAHPCPIEEIKKKQKVVVVEHMHYDKDGNERYFEVHGHPVFDDKGDVVQIIEYSLDITERKRLEIMLKRLATVDELTELYNRRGFMELAGQQMTIARRQRKQVELFYFDVDNFKIINDQFGHAEGDRALKDINDVLRFTFRASDIIARIGGDEFVAFTMKNAENAEGGAFERLRKNLEEFNGRGERQYILSMSMGSMTCDPRKKCSLEVLLKKADEEMYAQKQLKKQTPSSTSNNQNQ